MTVHNIDMLCMHPVGSGVAAISVIAVLVVIITLVLCVVVAIAIVMKLRAPGKPGLPA